MSTASDPAAPAGQSGPRLGRPRISDRRRRTTQLEIAHEAVRLFMAKGVANTSADEIASAAGMSTRTLWRYFSSKEQCVQPLLTAGIDGLVGRLREWLSDGSPSDLLREGALVAFVTAGELDSLRGLVRLTRTEPGLRAVWLQGHDEAVREITHMLADRSGQSPDSLPVLVQGMVLNAALTAAVEHWAWADQEELSIDQAIRDALHLAACALPDLEG